MRNKDTIPNAITTNAAVGNNPVINTINTKVVNDKNIFNATIQMLAPLLHLEMLIHLIHFLTFEHKNNK